VVRGESESEGVVVVSNEVMSVIFFDFRSCQSDLSLYWY
jgi:hypothetical protein